MLRISNWFCISSIWRKVMASVNFQVTSLCVVQSWAPLFSTNYFYLSRSVPWQHSTWIVGKPYPIYWSLVWLMIIGIISASEYLKILCTFEETLPPATQQSEAANLILLYNWLSAWHQCCMNRYQVPQRLVWSRRGACHELWPRPVSREGNPPLLVKQFQFMRLISNPPWFPKWRGEKTHFIIGNCFH